MDARSRPKEPWHMLLPMFGILTLCAVWSVYWFAAMAIAKKTVADQRQVFEARGLSLACARESWGGYPFRFEFICEAPDLSASRDVTATSGSVRAIAQAYAPWHIIILLDGPTRVQTMGGESFEASHQRAVASLKIGNDGAVEASVDVPQLNVQGWMEASRILAHSRPEPAGAIGVAVSVTGLNYQPSGGPPLRIAQSDLVGTLRTDAIFDVHRIELQDPPVLYRGSGQIGLDPQRRLSGLLNTETNDLDVLLAILDPHLHMNEQQRAAFKTVLGLLGQQAKIDLIARDGEFYIGPFKVADLVPLY